MYLHPYPSSPSITPRHEAHTLELQTLQVAARSTDVSARKDSDERHFTSLHPSMPQPFFHPSVLPSPQSPPRTKHHN